MSTPFYVVDHKAGPLETLPYEAKRTLRRGKPEALRLSAPETGTPDLHILTEHLAKPPKPGQAAKGGGSASWLARLFRGLRHAPM